MPALVAEHPVGAGGEAVEQTLGAQEVDVGEGAEEEQALDAGGEADQVEQERAPVVLGAQLVEAADRVHPLEAELGLGADRRDRLDGGEGLGPLVVVGQVVVEQREVELHVQRFLVELPGQEQAGLRGVDVLVQVEHEVVGDDRVAGGEEGDEAADEVALGGDHLAQVDEVVGEVDLLDRPRVADRRPVALVELRIAHRPQREVEARVEDRSTGPPAAALGWAIGPVGSSWTSDSATLMSVAHLTCFWVLEGAGDRFLVGDGGASASDLIGETSATGASS